MRLAVKKAADALAAKLVELATQFAAIGTPLRVPLSRGGLGLLRTRSPRGFVIRRDDPEVLMPDGRIWTGAPAGRYIDPRDCADNGVVSRMTVAGKDFAYFGVTVGGHAFGVTGLTGESEPRLCAVATTGGKVALVGADEALETIARAAGVHRGGGRHRRVEREQKSTAGPGAPGGPRGR